MRFGLTCVALLIGLVQGYADEKPQGELSPLEQKLIGEWQGGACMGDYHFYPDGTFGLVNFTPGQNILTGTWKLRHDAVPFTLALTYKTSDIRKRSPDRKEFEYLGKTLEVKVVELNEESFSFSYPGLDRLVIHTRGEKPEVKELAELQGTWIPLQQEERGYPVEPNTRHVIKGDTIAVQVDGKTVAEGKVVVDATKNPKQIDFKFTSGQTDLIIYVRTANYVICCGTRNGETRPTEFSTGAAKGGDYLLAWKIER